jgi:hypothetical protein
MRALQAQLRRRGLAQRATISAICSARLRPLRLGQSMLATVATQAARNSRIRRA